MNWDLHAGVVPTMDIMDSSASSNASSQDYSAVAESPNAISMMGSYSSQEQVSISKNRIYWPVSRPLLARTHGVPPALCLLLSLCCSSVPAPYLAQPKSFNQLRPCICGHAVFCPASS